jgi:hypothetical protein
MYRALLWLYPRDFRVEYADDLVSLLENLRTDKGPVRTFRICALDLAVTVPRMHLERIMNPTHTTTTIGWMVALLAAGGVASMLIGVYPGVLLLVAAALLAVTQRSELARSMRVPNTAIRRRRLLTAAVLAGVFVVSYLVYVTTIGDEWTTRETVLAVIGTASMVGSACYLIVGLTTPRDAARQA